MLWLQMVNGSSFKFRTFILIFYYNLSLSNQHIWNWNEKIFGNPKTQSAFFLSMFGSTPVFTASLWGHLLTEHLTCLNGLHTLNKYFNKNKVKTIKNRLEKWRTIALFDKERSHGKQRTIKQKCSGFESWHLTWWNVRKAWHSWYVYLKHSFRDLI